MVADWFVGSTLERVTDATARLVQAGELARHDAGHALYKAEEPWTGPVDELVLGFLRAGEGSEWGHSWDSLREWCAVEGVTDGMLRNGLEMLIAQGEVYSTIDDDHFKSA